MSKILPATCAASVVTVESQPVDSEMLSQGVRSSVGIAIIEEDEVTYVTSNAEDIKDALTQIKSVLNTIATALTNIGAGMTGATTAPPPTLATSVTSINAVATTLDTLKDNLK